MKNETPCQGKLDKTTKCVCSFILNYKRFASEDKIPEKFLDLMTDEVLDLTFYALKSEGNRLEKLTKEPFEELASEVTGIGGIKQNIVRLSKILSKAWKDTPLERIDKVDIIDSFAATVHTMGTEALGSDILMNACEQKYGNLQSKKENELNHFVYNFLFDLSNQTYIPEID